MVDVKSLKKKELIEIASWFNVSLSMSMKKTEMVQLVQRLLEYQAEQVVVEEIPMSARVRRIKEQNQGV